VLLAGDVGGTRARLTLLTPEGRTARHEVFESRAFSSLEAVLVEFLGKRPPRVTTAAFGVAGPVVKRRCTATNLPWVIDAVRIERRLRIHKVTLLNDLVALSLGAIGVPRSKLAILGNAGAPKKTGANVAVIAAGTGLGEAMLVWDADAGRLVANGTEGGHADFAPADELQGELLAFLRRRLGGHVSWERVVSGMGLGNLYDFMIDAKGMTEAEENVRTLEAAPDRNAAIAQLADAGRSEAARRARELLVRLYGAEAGNLALKTLAIGGVYVCGNIAAKLLPLLQQKGAFRKAFEDKGRFRPLLEKVPVAVVLDSDVGLAGARRVALEG
jgi:glucokinase